MGAASAGGANLVSIDNSALFDASASTDGLSYTTDGSGFNQKTFTLSTWFYLGSSTASIGGVGWPIFASDHGSANSETTWWKVRINTNGTLVISNWNDVTTTQVFRDIGWYNLVIGADTTQVAAAERYRVYVNGKRITSFSSTGYPSQNIDLAWGEPSEDHWIGNYDTANYAYNGYLAETVFKSGSQLGPESFGEFDSTGTYWTPLSSTAILAGSPTFYLNNATNPQTDASGNGNNFTNNGSIATSTHTPTNINCLLNPLRKNNSAVLSNGNRTKNEGATGWQIVMGTLGVSSGKWYWEVKAESLSDGEAMMTGIANDTVNVQQANSSGTGFYAYSTYGTTYSPSTSYGDTYGDDDIIGVQLNMDDGELHFYKNNTIQNSGTAAFTSLTGVYYPFTQVYNLYHPVHRFAEDEWSYTAPTGYKALTTTNIHALAPVSGSVEDMFKQTLAQEGFLISSVATARTGWSNYVDILKNRSSAEGWIYRFSHDSSNQYLFGTNANTTYQSTSTLSGTDNWVGFSIRIGSEYNTAGGSQAHSNGSATTVTHNLGNGINSSIKLFNRSTGAVYVYHIGNASGKLWLLTSNAVEASSTVITNVTANSFDIGSGASSATYDYLVMQDGGFISIGYSDSNSNNDGTYFSTGYVGLSKYNLFLTREVATGIYFFETDGISSNPVRAYMSHNTTDAEATSSSLQFGILGFKQTTSGWGTYNYLFEVVGPSTIDQDGRILTPSPPPPDHFSGNTVAIGGVVTIDGDYRIHTFLSSGTFTVIKAEDGVTLDYLVIAGAGSAGAGGTNASGGGGGGAGGYRSSWNNEASGGGGSSETGLTAAIQDYTITIGGGGAATSGANNGISGSDSVFGSITAVGGGFGAREGGGSGGTGGSGGGIAQNTTVGAGTSNQGFDGGAKTGGSGGSGGGGAGSVGSNAVLGNNGGAGGSGVASTITGLSVSRAGGGGGGSYLATGGSASSGAGRGGNSNETGISGTANTGGGGGGRGGQNSGTGGAGGSGVVIIRYQFK